MRWVNRLAKPLFARICFLLFFPSPQAEHGTAFMLEFLREEGIRLAAEAAEKLRPVGVANGPFTEYDLLSVQGASDSDLPEVRAGYAIVQSGPTTYMFGGHVIGGTITDELWELRQSRLAWQLITARGRNENGSVAHTQHTAEHPCARIGATLAASEDGESLYLFGGTDSAGKYLNDLYTFDVSSSQWSKVATEGTVPSPRENASIGEGGRKAGGRERPGANSSCWLSLFSSFSLSLVAVRSLQSCGATLLLCLAGTPPIPTAPPPPALPSPTRMGSSSTTTFTSSTSALWPGTHRW